MRRSPFYAYPSYPHSFYAPAPAEEASYYHRPRRPPFPPSSSPAPTPRSSVINIPVFDSSPSSPSSLPPHKQPNTPPPASPPLIDPSSAAATIQSCFRGFSVRRHGPLLHLRSIAKARKQLEELQSELESPAFPLKLRESEKERLRFSESVMAIILRLDAIEGSMAEVRSQRKEATRMAIKLQDAIDAIMMQKDKIADLQPTDGLSSNGGGGAPEDEEPLCPDTDMVEGGVHGAVSEEGIMNVNAMQEESTPLEDDVDVADNCLLPNLNPNNDVTDVVDENVSRLLPLKVDSVAGQQIESVEFLMSKSGCFEPVGPQVTPAEVVYDAEQDMLHGTGENAGSDASHMAEEEAKSGIDALHLVSHNIYPIQNNALVAKVDQDASVDDMKLVANPSSDASYACIDVVQEFQQGLNQDVPATPTAEEQCDHPHYSNAAHQSLEAYENPSDELKPCDEAKAQSSTLSMVGAPPSPDSALLHQLSEDCRQLRSLAGKLIARNKAQSKVLCALGQRLELLEHQQQLNCQHNQQQRACEKRKLKKGSKRSMKCRNCE